MLAHQRHPSQQNNQHDAYANNTPRYRNSSIASNNSSSHHHPQPELFIGTFDFETTEPDQVSFRRGAILPIILKEPSGWWAALVNGRYGWVPAAFLEPWVPPHSNSGASPLSPTGSLPSGVSSPGGYSGIPSGRGGSSGLRNGGRGSVTAESVADLPLYSEEDSNNAYDDSRPLSPGEHEEYYHHDADLRNQLSSSDSYNEDEPITPLRSIDDYDADDPLVGDLIAHFSGTGIQGGRRSSGGALPAYAMHSPHSNQTPTSFNNYSMAPPRSGGSPSGHAYANSASSSNSARDFYAPPYDPPIPHQLSLVIEEGSDVNSQWSMPHSSQAFSTTSSASALKKQQQQQRGVKGGSAHTVMNTHSGSQRSPTSPSISSASAASMGVSTAALQRQRIAYSSIPWYLRPKHAWDELKLDADGLVVAGTAPALIERLVMDSTLSPSQESMFRHTMLATLRVWTTAEVLFDSLVGYYMMTEPEGMSAPEQLEWKEKKMRPTQMRVLCVFGLWIEKYGLLVDDPKVVPRLRTWLSTILSPTGLALSAKQLVQSIDRIQHADDTSHAPSTSPSGFSLHLGASLRRKPKPPKSDFLKWDASDVANHLTLAEARAYARIRPYECLAWTKVGGKVKKDAAGMTVTDDTAGKAGEGGDGAAAEVKNLMAFVAMSDRLAMWVKNTVLCCESLGRRADMIDFWIKIGERCRNLNNIFSMSAIVAALSGGDVGKLHLTWAHVSRASNFEQLVKLTDPTGNFSAYRAFHASLSNQAEGSNISSGATLASTGGGGGGSSIYSTSPSTLASTSPTSVLSLSPTRDRDGFSTSNTGPPCVPFISPFLTELMHINDHFPSTIPTPQGPEPSQAPPRPLINVMKLQRQADAISNLLRFVDRLNLNGVSTPTGSTHSGVKGSSGEGYRAIAEKENPAMVSAMEAQMEAAAAEAKKDAGYFWKRSQELQGMEVTHADIWKNLNDAGF